MRPRLPGGRLEIIGSDADPIVLCRAEKGCFSSSSLKDVPARWREIAFARDGDRYCVRAEYREGLAFLFQDIRSEIPAGFFDLILCRNLVFTYFDIERQRETLDRIAAALRDGGYLVIGAHETLPDDGRGFTPISGCREILCMTQPPRPEVEEREHRGHEQHQALKGLKGRPPVRAPSKSSRGKASAILTRSATC